MTLKAQGGEWIDSSIAFGGGDAAKTALHGYVVSGGPPAAVQLKRLAIWGLAKDVALKHVSDVFTGLIL
jgi:glucose/mannose transport system substrate-binding protein